MSLYTLTTEQRLAISIDEAWAFFSNPANLAAITPESLAFRVLHDLPPEMYAGMIIRYKIRPLFGVDMEWVTEITHVDAPHYFVDEQRFGPYRFWHHQHHFRAIDGGVEMRDIVTYSPPSPAAPLIDRLLVGPRVRGIFDHRRRVLAERFGEIA
jgi:ligand-binding SRPBCC domain-containing protein